MECLFLLQKQIEDLIDRLRCAEENLQTKRDELEEKNELCETAQEQVIQLSGELNALRSESDTASKYYFSQFLKTCSFPLNINNTNNTIS